jgi:hypothetical protein
MALNSDFRLHFDLHRLGRDWFQTTTYAPPDRAIKVRDPPLLFSLFAFHLPSLLHPWIDFIPP